MLLKFSNILAFWIASWHREILHIADLARELVVTWTWRLVFLTACDVWTLARTETELWRLMLQSFRIARVLAWPWHESLTLRHGTVLEFRAHRVVGS